MENYEQKYKKALERMKSWAKGEHPECFSEAQKAAEFVFPELKEDEDERIRKEIIDCIKTLNEQNNFPYYKEQFDTWNENTANSWITWLEKQNHDGKKWMSDSAYEGLTKLHYNTGVESVINNPKKYGLVKERKQQEWGEQDIEMIDWLINCCKTEYEKLCNNRYGHQEIVSDLKSDCRRKRNWLESLKNKVSLQNHWKPTEEQMDQLYNAATMNEYVPSFLLALYNDLKKL